MQEDHDMVERQATLEIVGLIEIWLQELSPGKIRGLFELTRWRLSRLAERRWGRMWAEEAVLDFRPDDEIGHLDRWTAEDVARVVEGEWTP